MNLFLFSGRIGRLEWWITAIALTVINITISVTLVTLGIVEGEVVNGETVMKELSSTTVLFVSVFGFAMMWISLANNAKRFHDRGKSGFWQLVCFIPLIGPIWLLIELGILPGDAGSNSYGPPTNEGSTNNRGRRVKKSMDKSWAKQGGYAEPDRQQENVGKPVFGKRKHTPIASR